MFRTVLLLSSLLVLFLGGVAVAQIDEPALPDGATHEEIVQALENQIHFLNEVRRRGLAVFSTPFNTFDGLGDGPFDPAELDTRAFGQRPTLQGNGLFLRVNGLDAQSCNECHTIVSNRTTPPTLGFGGVGGAVQNAIIMPTLIDVADSADDRVNFVPGHDPSLPLVFDGEADYNGRFANPPFLFGGGGVELLGKEMTLDLQALLDVAQSSPAGTVVSLDTHGVNFGHITSLGGGDVDLSEIEGIGFTPEVNEERTPEEVLVVRPFGRKGENFSMRDFDRGAMQFHFGMQPVEVVGEGNDVDGDGVEDEVTVGEMTALHVFDVTNPRPFVQELSNQAQQGFNRFQMIGCNECHMPVLETESRFLPLAHPEVADDPLANVYAFIDLVEVGFEPAPGGGVYVPLFADLKRHNMGPGLQEDFEGAEIPNSDFTTARLWGIADTAPYIHDGRASTLFQAIAAHGGEAQTARDAFLGLSAQQQGRVIAFLRSLRVPEAPNQDLLP
ncbi:MAG TPA: di-heme oxidoredictase family protein [Acidobacteriota bacterium]|nr:di-heme oxidoredictase family protein [Acidobacteriota bacterium]